MTKYTLDKILLTQFKQFDHLAFEPKGQDALITARNGIGKTTLLDAFLWCLTGKDSLGRGDYELKPIGKDGKEIEFTTPTVEVVFRDQDGDTITFKRAYHEIREAPRGKADKVYTGNEGKYEVNTMGCTATEFKQRVAKFAGCNIQLLCDTNYFADRMEWKERRALLFEMCGELTDKEIIDASPELAELSAQIGKRTVAEMRKIAKDTGQLSTKERDAIPLQIKENMQPASKVERPSESKLDLENKVKELQDKRAGLLAGGGTAQVTEQINKAKAAVTAYEMGLRQQHSEIAEGIRESNRKHASAVSDLEFKIESGKRQIAADDALIRDSEARLERMREAYRELAAQTYNGSTDCPSCGQALPPEQIASAVEKFNADLATRKGENHKAGDDLKAEIAEVKVKLDAKLNKLKEYEVELAKLKDQPLAAVPEFSLPDPSKDAKYKALLDAHAELVAKKATLAAGDNSAEIAAVDTEIKTAQASIEVHAYADAQEAESERKAKRVADLSAREKELSVIIETQAKLVHLCDEFTRIKVSALTDRINSRFGLARFRLFEDNITNEGIKEKCDVLWHDNLAVPSHGQKVRCGLDIIKTLGQHFGVRLPIFVDNAESISEFPETGCQLIRLVHDPIQTTLRIEIGSAPTPQLQEALSY